MNFLECRNEYDDEVQLNSKCIKQFILDKDTLRLYVISTSGEVFLICDIGSIEEGRIKIASLAERLGGELCRMK